MNINFLGCWVFGGPAIIAFGFRTRNFMVCFEIFHPLWTVCGGRPTCTCARSVLSRWYRATLKSSWPTFSLAASLHTATFFFYQIWTFSPGPPKPKSVWQYFHPSLILNKKSISTNYLHKDGQKSGCILVLSHLQKNHLITVYQLFELGVYIKGQ